jgi:hypothetical protein
MDDLAFVDMVLTLDVDMNVDTSNKTHMTYGQPVNFDGKVIEIPILEVE